MQTLVLIVLVVRGVFGVSPVFTTPDPDSSKDANKIYMSELLKGDDKVITLAATDADTSEASLVFTMDTSPDATKTLFTIDGTDLKVINTVAEGTFDYDKNGAIREYDITLKVSDGTDEATVQTKIYIQDVNDNTPEFKGSPPYMGNVLESTAGGTSVYKMEATDNDGSVKNNKITYGITGTTQFEIHPDTGVISTVANAAFDLTTTPQYQMTVTATDGGDIPKANVATLTLKIVAAPKFDNLATSKAESIDENVQANTPVFTLTVSDKDTADGDLIVTIKSQTPDTPQMFKLDDKILRTNTDGLDAEVQQSYTLKFEVTDGSNPVESATLTVNVNDLNDNIPTITSVAPVTIQENKATGTTSEVIDIDATDADATEPNKKLSYAIISGNSDGIFDIFSTSGLIYLANAPKSMTVNQHVFTVRVSDGATTPKTATVEVTVNINENTVNECSDTPCQNGAGCTSFVNDYSCTCVTGYGGTNCETNINDCTASSCKNGGTCVDGVNGFSCNCAAGYTGTTCTDVCTNNKHGRGCTEACSCNASRLLDDVGTQTCEPVSGACKCNTKWTGNVCQTDVNECTSATICSAVANKICVNIIGSYYCTCKTGYTEKSDFTCERSPAQTLTAGANELKIRIKMTLDKDCITRDIPSVYAAEKDALEGMLETKLRPVKRSLVTDIECGSETFDSVIIIENTDKAKAQLASDLQTMRDGETLNVGGVNTKVTTMTVDSKTLSATTSGETGPKVCEVYTAYATCSAGDKCKYTDGAPSCRADDDDDIALILGLTLGLLLPLIIGVILVVIYCHYRHHQRTRDERTSVSTRRDKYERENWRDGYHNPYDRPWWYYLDFNQRPDKREMYGLPPLENAYTRY